MMVVVLLCTPGRRGTVPSAASTGPPGTSDSDDIDSRRANFPPLLTRPLKSSTDAAGAVAKDIPLADLRVVGGITDSDETDEDVEWSDQRGDVGLAPPATPCFLVETTTATGEGGLPTGMVGETIGSTSEAAATAIAVAARAAAAAAAAGEEVLPSPPLCGSAGSVLSCFSCSFRCCRCSARTWGTPPPPALSAASMEPRPRPSLAAASSDAVAAGDTPSFSGAASVEDASGLGGTPGELSAAGVPCEDDGMWNGICGMDACRPCDAFGDRPCPLEFRSLDRPTLRFGPFRPLLRLRLRLQLRLCPCRRASVRNGDNAETVPSSAGTSPGSEVRSVVDERPTRRGVGGAACET